MTFEPHALSEERIDVAAMLKAVVVRLPRIIAVTLVLLAVTFVFLLFQPRLYESSASILVEPRSNIYTRSVNEQAPTISGNEAGVVSSQIELLKSRDTLLKVIDQLDLRSVPEFNGASSGFSPLAVLGQLLGRGPTANSIEETVLNNLYDRMTVSQERDSRIISVVVTSIDPQLAADIANAVANAHVARRAQLSLSDTAEASTWLSEEIAKLRVSVTKAETAVANFKVSNDLFVGTNNTSLFEQQLSTVSGQITAAQERKSTALSRAALIRGMIDRGQPLDGIADVRESVVIQRLSEEKARLQGELAQRSATLLSNHPTILALNAQIRELNNQISSEARSVAEALESEAQIQSDLEASLRAEMSRAKASSSTATQDTVELDSLERDAKAQRDLLAGYLQRYSEAVSRVDSNSALPDVRVVSVAAPTVNPASPKTTMILLMVGILAFVGQVGLVTFSELMSGRAIVAGRAPEYDDAEEAEVELEPAEPWSGDHDELVDEVTAEAMSEPVADVANSGVATLRPLVDDTPATAPDFIAPFDADLDEVEADVPPVMARTRASTGALRAAAASEIRPAVQAERVVQPTPPLEGIVSLADISADLVLGRTHLVILAGHGSNQSCEVLAEELISDALARGLGAALVDAGSGRATDEAGLTDLSYNDASFGDVVHKSADNSFAEVPWGTSPSIERSSERPITLVDALGDIYEVVVLMTGRVGKASSLPSFAGLQGRLVLVVNDDDDVDSVVRARDLLARAGFGRVEVAAIPERVAA